MNELYDRGCDLVEAAAAIRRAAASPTVARAVPALLGCFESALDELEGAALALGIAAEIAARAAPDGRSRAEDRRQRMHVGFAHLEDGLRDSKRFASATRALAARALEEAGVTRTRTALRS